MCGGEERGTRGEEMVRMILRGPTTEIRYRRVVGVTVSRLIMREGKRAPSSPS